MGVGGRGEKGKRQSEKGEFRRAMRRGLTTLHKIKSSRAVMLAESKTLIYCHC